MELLSSRAPTRSSFRLKAATTKDFGKDRLSLKKLTSSRKKSLLNCSVKPIKFTIKEKSKFEER
tara:strand:- start:92 stop:283 length:192 start_codon:yes stop_codon:yes gene_type:complete